MSHLKNPVLFVCSHNTRDKRCGTCGPVLVHALKAGASALGFVIDVYPCSHIGGHDMAGNVIAFYRRHDGSGMNNCFVGIMFSCW